MIVIMWPLLLLPLVLPEPTSVVRARGELRELVVAEARSLRGYSHERFMPSWTEAEGACDTREVVLRRDAVSVTTDVDCEAVRGTWFSEYDGLTLHSEEQIDVDHLVPLANAWVSGANAWTDERRQAFANDLTRPELIAVSESVNLDKAGSSPATWRPPRRSYWCTYARAWITVKHHYGLTITYREKRALIRMLRTCFSAQPSA
ncbi:HNH endonuclease family protein [Nonomuraea sp. NPDC005692]|uniref:HNH endonuclease family protein n=1 Tax=Nonomuraea sp. NPDC005692 TaxID=3157168 RepID=UPI0033D1037E